MAKNRLKMLPLQVTVTDPVTGQGRARRRMVHPDVAAYVEPLSRHAKQATDQIKSLERDRSALLSQIDAKLDLERQLQSERDRLRNRVNELEVDREALRKDLEKHKRELSRMDGEAAKWKDRADDLSRSLLKERGKTSGLKEALVALAQEMN